MDKNQLSLIWKRYLKKKDKKNKKKLVEHYFYFVQNLAKKLAVKFKYKLSPEELASHGVTGLYKAIENYDPIYKTKFETYAYIKVRGSIIDEMRKEDWVPRSVRIRQSNIEKTKRELETEIGDQVTEEQVLKRLKIGLPDYSKNLQKYHAIGFASIEHNIEESEENKKDFNKYLTDTCEPSPGSELIRKEFLNKLIGSHFSSTEQKIIYLYYYDRLTMRDIAALLEMSESRISQIHQHVLKKLRKKVKVNPNYFCRDVMNLISSCNDKNPLF